MVKIMKKYISFTNADIEKCLLNSHTYDETVARYLVLKSVLKLNGLSKLKSMLDDDSKTIKTIRKLCENDLWEDLSMFLKRDPEKDDYESHSKTQILKDFEKFSYASRVIEKISASSLALLMQKCSKEELKKYVNEELEKYKAISQKQTAKDLPRNALFLSINNGDLKLISEDFLMNSPDLPLTGEQREFLTHAWDQATFDSGWFAISGFSQFIRPNLMLEYNSRTNMLIDVSEGKVTVSNGSTAVFRDEDGNIPDDNPAINAAFTVDISALKGDHFTFGCATGDVEFYFEHELKNIHSALTVTKLPLPRTLPVSITGGLIPSLHERMTSWLVDELLQNGNMSSKVKGVLKDFNTQELLYLKLEKASKVDVIKAHLLDYLSEDVAHQAATKLYCALYNRCCDIDEDSFSDEYYFTSKNPSSESSSEYPIGVRYPYPSESFSERFTNAFTSLGSKVLERIQGGRGK